jgi:DNA-directed RNA polymerase subunit N
MLIPIRCFTCGKMLADKSAYYKRELLKKRMSNKDEDPESELVLNLNVEEIKKTPAGEIMDDLGLIRKCCRKTMLTNIELIDEI